MAALLEAITVKRKMYFEYENTPYYCMEAEVSTPTARGGQTLVRLKMRNLLTRAVFDLSLIHIWCRPSPFRPPEYRAAP